MTKFGKILAVTNFTLAAMALASAIMIQYTHIDLNAKLNEIRSEVTKLQAVRDDFKERIEAYNQSLKGATALLESVTAENKAKIDAMIQDRDQRIAELQRIDAQNGETQTKLAAAQDEQKKRVANIHEQREAITKLDAENAVASQHRFDLDNELAQTLNTLATQSARNEELSARAEKWRKLFETPVGTASLSSRRD